MFAGALAYTPYGWLKRHLTRRVSRHEGGDTDITRDYDYTDWEAVHTFAEDFARLVNERAAAQSRDRHRP